MGYNVSYCKEYLLVESPDTPLLRKFAPIMEGVEIRPGLWIYPSCRANDILWEYQNTFPQAEYYKPHGSVCIQVSVDAAPSDPAYYVAGFSAAHRSNWERPVVLGPGVQVLAGGFPPTGGNAAAPALAPYPGTVLAICRVDTHTAVRLIMQAACQIVDFRGDDANFLLELRGEGEGCNGCVSLWARADSGAIDRLMASDDYGPHRCLPGFEPLNDEEDWEEE